MFTLIKLFTGIAILVFVGFTIINVKNRYVNHEDNPFLTPSVSSVASSTFGGIKDYMASRQSGSGTGGGFFSGGNNSQDTFRGGYLNSRPEAVGRTTTETACDYYPDQCNKDTNRATPND
jgi:hypothetical protein